MIPEAIFLHYFNALMDGDKNECALIVTSLVEKRTSVRDIYEHLFKRSMYKVGHLWEKDKFTVASEHLASKITDSMMNLLYPKIQCTKKNGKTIIVTCIDKEFHELGARMVSDYFELNGWTAYFLGANTPTPDLITIIKEKRPDVVGLSNNFYINYLRLLKLIDKIKEEMPDQDIIVGGQAIASSSGDTFTKHEHVYTINSFDEIDDFLAFRS